ncbi:MAG: MFS transporter [Acidobacteria bacterium]|nr:MFS transporter [Acidobacteriota bacterium]
MRSLILTMLFGFSFVSYLERVNISIAAELMMPALSMTKLQMGQIFSSFLIGYAIFQIPAGLLGDSKGPRFTLSLAALLWGVTTVLTGSIPGLLVKSTTGTFLSLWVLRFVLGSGEAATYPVGMRAVHNWMPPRQRALGNSVMFVGSSAATAIAGPLISFLMVKFGWRESFYLSSSVAFFIAGVWYGYARDYPEQGTGTEDQREQVNDSNTAAAEYKKLFSISTLLRDRRVLFLSVSYVSEGYVLFIFVFWLYIYLVDVRGFNMLKGGMIESLPWLAAVALAPIGGIICDRLSAQSTRLSGARSVIMLGYGVSGALLFVAAEASSRVTAVAALCISVGALYFAESAFWTAAVYLSGEHAGAVSGIMNTAGILGGIASTLLVPILVQHFGWLSALSSGALMALLCTVLWWVLGHESSLTAKPVSTASA